jgi:hypothetical protein
MDFVFGKDHFPKRIWQLVWESPSSTRIFNGLQYSFQVWQGFINFSESFSYKDFLFILVTTRKEDFSIISTFKSDFLVYLELLKSDKFDSSIFRILIFVFFVFFYFLLSFWVIITYLGQL